jgi:hypothetical protein
VQELNPERDLYVQFWIYVDKLLCMDACFANKWAAGKQLFSEVGQNLRYFYFIFSFVNKISR